jgi:hypothetical protein
VRCLGPRGFGSVGLFMKFVAAISVGSGPVSRAIAGAHECSRVDDPGVARQELAHRNGWKHPQP